MEINWIIKEIRLQACDVRKKNEENSCSQKIDAVKESKLNRPIMNALPE